jgi:hypothetical protein
LGSALGPGGLHARIAHHQKLSPRPHWHIDCLRVHCRVHCNWFSGGRALVSSSVRQFRSDFGGKPFLLKAESCREFPRNGIVIGGVPTKHPSTAMHLNESVYNRVHLDRPVNCIVGKRNTIPERPESVKASLRMTKPLTEGRMIRLGATHAILKIGKLWIVGVSVVGANRKDA